MLLKNDQKLDLDFSKISNEDLNILQDLVSNINKNQMQIGLLESQKHNTLHNMVKLNNELLALREQFKNSYGTDDININDGTINTNEIN